MNVIPHDDPLAIAVVEAIQTGDTARLQQQLAGNGDLAGCRIRDEDASRSLLHIATDWPGDFPNVGETIRLLVASGADVNAQLDGPNAETPLHWAASSNDVAAIDALLDGGADLDAQGAVIAGGDPLEDAIGFQNWEAARRLVERGARTRLGDEAALGLLDRIRDRFEGDAAPSRESIDYSFWNACCAGQQEAAEFLYSKGADVNWVPEWCDENPLDGAVKSGNQEMVRWLEAEGAVSNVK